MARIVFGEWMPDQPGITGALAEAKNVVPLQAGYGPFPLPSNISNDASEPLINAFSATFSTATVLFAGSENKLYKLDPSSSDLDNVSQLSGGSPVDYTATANWDFVQFGNVVIAANGQDKLQGFTSGTSTNFADLDAAAPAAQYVTVVRDFVVAARTTANPNRVFWSDINDETDWTPGVNSQSDTQDIPDGGNIQAVTGGEFGLVLMERAISRMSYVGAPLFFQFDTISRKLGCYESNSVVQYGNLVWFLSDDGFYVCDGQNVTPIGNERVDKFFFRDVNQSLLGRMSAAVDPINKLVVWCYPNTSGTNSLLIYNWQLNRWSRGITAANKVASLASSTITLEGLDVFGTIDSLGSSLDSRLWVGGKLFLGGIFGSKVVSFTGASSEAEIRTGDITGQGQTMVMLARPQIDRGSASVAVASRFRLDDAISYSDTVAADSENRVSLRSRGNYHRIKVIPTGSWQHAVAIDVDLVPVGVR